MNLLEEDENSHKLAIWIRKTKYKSYLRSEKEGKNPQFWTIPYSEAANEIKE